MQFGRLEQESNVRDFWKSEAQEFTPWVVANIDQLSEALGIELEVQSSEASVGPFRADIVCRVPSDEDQLVLIENQLERTDHSHLGQLLTYAAGLNAVTVVWIARRFADEHRAALDWLNAHTAEHLRFFGVETKVWRIGQSLPAVQFEVVSRPNDWANQARTSVDATVTSGQQAQLAYWSALREYGLERGLRPIPGTPQKQNWIAFGVGRGGFNLSMVASRADALSLQPEDHLRVELNVFGADAQHNFDYLRTKEAEIETALGPMIYYQVEGVNWRRIYQWQPADLDDQNRWPKQFDWLVERAAAFDRYFRPMIATLPTT